MAHIDLIVLYTSHIERLCAFYASLGFRFVEEQHGGGPRHYAASAGDLVLELYPTRKCPSRNRLGISVDNIEALLASVDAGCVLGYAVQSKTALLIDPDGRRIDVKQLRQKPA